MILIILAFFMVCFYGIEINRKNIWNIDYFNQYNTTSIRGALAIYILIIHTIAFSKFHYEQKIFNFLLECFVGSGYLAVGIFFMFSGYGLMYGFINKKDYLNNFFEKRFNRVIIPFIITNIIYIIVYKYLGIYFSVQEIIMSFFTASITSNAWYIICIIIFYIAFYVLFKFLEINRATIYMVYFIIVYMFICYIFNVGAWWYVSCLSCALGIILALKENYILKKCKKRYIYLICATILGFIFIYKLSIILSFFNTFNHYTIYIMIVEKIISSAIFSMILVLLLLKVKIGNYILRWFGQISLELYLIHGLVITILGNLAISNKAYFLMLVLLISTILAYILNLIYSKIISIYCGILKRIKINKRYKNNHLKYY